MNIPSDDDVLKECDELGEAAVEARLKAGHFSSNSVPAYQWLNKRRREQEDERHRQIIRSTNFTAWASWALVVITAAGVSFQTRDTAEQLKHMVEQIEQQRKDNEAQRKDAKDLLAVQISVELDKQFDSVEMRRARRILADQLLHHKEVTETRVLDFFEKVGMYSRQGRLDEDTVYASYSYWVERYWPRLEKEYVDGLRKEQDGSNYYGEFEGLYTAMIASDAKESGRSVDAVKPSKREIERFLKEEATLLK